MPLTLYNTATRARMAFDPLEPGHVRMYVCGPTVYDRAHIGNARAVVVFDVLARLLRRLYPRVTYVRNITDVDDKINAAAAARGISIRTLTDETEALFQADMAALGALPPDVEPRVTDTIDGIIGMIARLIDKGHAYEADGHVLFATASMPDYGALSGRSTDELIAGARVEVAPYKRAATDFVLWKPSTPELPGWESPWGRGRPGWHIECSAMAERHLGETIDIHGGGVDLVFPHHENELAQSVCAHDGRPFARFWLHNGMLTVDGEKMSKSLGNFITVGDALEKAPGEVIRLMMLQTHYRQPLDWRTEGVAEAKATLDRFYLALRRVAAVEPGDEGMPAALREALEDDLNTPLALTHLHDLVTDLNKATDPYLQAVRKSQILDAGAVLGLLGRDPEAWLKGGDNALALEIERLIAERLAARKAKDFAAADRIRDELLARGILLEDAAGTTSWRKV